MNFQKQLNASTASEREEPNSAFVSSSPRKGFCNSLIFHTDYNAPLKRSNTVLYIKLVCFKPEYNTTLAIH